MAGLADLLAAGDPEAASAATASQAIAPAVGSYLANVLSGRMAAQAVPQDYYDPNRSFAQNALDPRAIDQAANIGLGFSGGGLGIKAYHGSPYDFNAFDASKIGTGEGAQAYGHGLYFAEKPGTAEAYKQNLAQRVYATNTSDKLNAGDAFQTLYDAAKGAPLTTARGVQFNLHPDQARAVATNILDGLNDSGTIDRYLKDYVVPDARTGQFGVAYQAAVQKAKDLELKVNPGHMYEVNINADPASFLNWDKPLSQQSPQVQSALTSLSDVYPTTQSKLAPRLLPGQDATGNHMYQAFAQHMSSDPTIGASAVAQELQGTGIPGIRYLDQGSRGAGQGTSNYVVFDPSIIDIVRKYGLAGVLAGGSATGATQGGQ